MEVTASAVFDLVVTEPEPVFYTICPRHGTISEFQALNRIYQEAELLLEKQGDGSWKLKAGDGTLGYNSLPFVGEAGTSSNSFVTISVPNQADIIADSSTDTLHISSSSGISITTNASTDLMTIAPVYGTSAGTICQGNDSRLAGLGIRGAFVEDYGALGEPSDDTNAINSAISTGLNVYFRNRIYNVTALNSLNTGQYLIGNGPSATIIRSTSTTASVITIGNGVSNAGVIGMTISRTVTPTSGASGIVTAHTGTTDVVSLIELRDLELDHHWNGLRLGPTGWSVIRDVMVENCYNAGILMIPTAGTGSASSYPLQWTLDHVLVELCNGHGIYVAGVDQTLGAGTMLSLGEWKNISTFANSGGGIAVVGTASCGLCGVRLGSNTFLGSDGNNEIYLDTYGYNHTISAYAELAGGGATGVNSGTAASHVGRGIVISANNSGVMIHDSFINGCSYEGIYSQANLFGSNTAPVTIANCMITNNGTANSAGSQSGVMLSTDSGGGMVINGGFIGQWNTAPGTGTQKYGVAIATDSIAITGCRIRGNATQDVLAQVTLTGNSYLDPLAS